MLKTNITGSIIVCLILFAIIGYVFSLGLDVNWNLYFKVAAIVAIIAALISIIAFAMSGRDKA